MKIVITFISILFVTGTAQARFMKAWSYQELYDKSDIVVIARAISTLDTTEHTYLTNVAPEIQTSGDDLPLVGVSTEFAINLVLKGDNSITKVTLHHYRMGELPSKIIVTGGPNLASFDPNSGTHFLLFLRRGSDGRYEPVSGQADPILDSILTLPPSPSSSDFLKDQMQRGTWQTNKAISTF